MKCHTCGIPESMCPCGEAEPAAAGEVTFQWASDDRAEHADFLAEGLIPAHCLSLLTGREGSGKSTLAGRWLADATRGRLPGAFHGQPMGVLVMAVEDSWHSRWIPRLCSYHADMSRIARDPGFTRVGKDGTPYLDLLALTDDDHLARLGQAARNNDIGLMFLDHLSEALGPDARTNDYGQMVTALRRLNQFARQYEITLVGGWHLSKGGGAVADKIIGSVGIRSSARSVLTVAEEPGTGLRWLAVTKSNDLPSDLPARSFTIVETTARLHGEVFATTVASDPEASDHPGTGRDFVNQLIERAASGDRPTDGDGAAITADRWLEDFLSQAGGACLKSFVVAHGEPVGYSERSLERASERLDLVRVPRGRKVEWRLRDDTFTSATRGYGDGGGGGGGQPPPTSATSDTRVTQDSGGGHSSPIRDVPEGTLIDLDQLRTRLDTNQ